MSRDKDRTDRIRMGDVKEFESLFRSSYSSLVRYARSIVGDYDTAEEIVQDLFYRLWKERKKIKIESSLNGYLFRSVYNRSLHYIKHKKIADRYESEMVYLGHNSPATPLQHLQHSELQDRIASTLEKLPERCGEIFYLNRFEGLKYKEIAERLAVSIKTVEANMGRALNEFRKAVSGL